MKYKKYPNYKDSGIDWLGQIPEHWTKQSIKTLMNLHKGINREKNPTVLSVTLNGIKIKDIESGKGQLSESYENYNPVTPKHIVFNPMDLISGFVGKPPISGVVSPAYTSMTVSKKCNIDFYIYLFQKFYHEKILFPYGKGVSFDHRWTINNETFFGLSTLFPPLAEQKQIANFLDNAITKINKLIEKQTNLIELLTEKRQTLITHAVTRGINPNVKIKDTYITWLDKIPSHWTEKQFRYATKIFRGKFGHRPRNDPSFYDGVYPFIQTGDVARANKYITKYKQTLNNKGIKVSEKFPKGTLVMAIAANIGDVAILDFEAYAPDSIVGFLPNKDIDLMYLRYSFIGTINILKSTAIQSTQANLNIDRIANVNFLFPPLEEQEEIVRYLDEKIAKMDRLIEKANESIKLLKEKRITLISAVVTGKVDVRELI